MKQVILNNLEVLLKALEEEYNTLPVRVEVIRDHEPIVYNNEKYELIKGTEIDLPRWIAYELASRNIVIVREEPQITIEDLSKYLFLEIRSLRTPSALQRIPKDFYPKLRLLLKRLREKLDKEFNVQVLEEYHKVERYSMEIIQSRLSKILAAIQSPEELKDVIDKMTPEERVLYTFLRETINYWVERVLGRKCGVKW